MRWDKCSAQVLGVLKHHYGGLTSKALARIMHVSHGTAGRWLVRLVAEGRVRRQTYFSGPGVYTWLYFLKTE